MTYTARAGSDNDQLVRTTLQLEGTISVADVTASLQREPGVLLVEMNPPGERAIVAHDPAVQVAALLAAVVRAGARAKMVPDERILANGRGTLPALAQRRVRYVATAAAALLVSLAVIDVSFPKSIGQHWLLPIVMSSLWGFFFAQAIVRRRS